MAAKSILKSSASALIAFALGTAALLPAAASAQERDQRGPRGGERVERSSPAQAPAWQGRAPAANPQPSWNNRPGGSGFGGGYQASQTPRPANQGNWNRDRERGDRGNGASPIGQPTTRPAWTYNGAQGSYQGSQPPRPGTTTGTGAGTPAWGGRNSTYSDPARGQQGGRDTAWSGRDGGGNDARGNDGRGNGGRSWADRGDRDRDGNLIRDRGQDRDRDRDRDRNRDWRGNNNSQWSGNWNSNGSRDWRRDRDGWRGNGWNNNRWANNDWRGNRWNDNHWGNNGWRGWDRDGWRRNNRYDWSNWRNRHRSSFSLGFYYAPWQGYNYSRFDIGVVIGQPFYAERYWLADPWAYRLPPADGPYRWVRYYNDALLVDIYSGEVVDAVYDIFW